MAPESALSLQPVTVRDDADVPDYVRELEHAADYLPVDQRLQLRRAWAIGAAAQFKPQIVFMDIGLPGLSGHEAAARMRKELAMDEVYMVALSGYGTEEDRRRSMEAGFNDHLVKPLDPGTLPSILGNAGGGRPAMI